MDPLLASFVGVLGPGQIIDLHSLAAIPSGFLKIGICNDVNEVCMVASDFKESLEQSSLDIRLSIKAFLTSGGDVIDGLVSPFERTTENNVNCDATTIRFNKSQLWRGEVITESENSADDINPDHEVVQIGIYAWKSLRSRTKHLIGFVHVNLNEVQPNSSRYNLQAWYKIFPTSSIILGYPVTDLSRFHINVPRSSTTTPTSPVPPDIIRSLTSLPSKQKYKIQSSSSNSTDVSAEVYQQNIPKNNSFRNVAKALSKFMKKRKDPQDSLEEMREATGLQRSMTITNVKDNKLWKSSSMPSSGKNLTLDNRINTTNRFGSKRFESLKKFKLPSQFSKSSSLNGSAKKIKRCDEIICVPSPVETPKTWESENKFKEFLVENNQTVTDLTAEILFESAGVKQGKKSNSVETDSEEASSLDASEVGSHLQGPRNKDLPKHQKIVSSMCSWAQRAKGKVKLRSVSPYSSPLTEQDQYNAESDNVYEVLKFIQTLPKQRTNASLDKNLPNSSDCSECSSSVADPTEISDTKSETLLSPNPVILLAPAPDVDRGGEEMRSEGGAKVDSELTSDASECVAKRENFAQRRSRAVDSPENFNLFVSSRRLSVRSESDDDYATCCERMSSTNISLTSCYTTASERG